MTILYKFFTAFFYSINLIFDQFAQKRNIPAGNGKTVELRKFADLSTNKSDRALTENSIPDGQNLTVSKVSSLQDRLLFAPTEWHSPDMKSHKLFKENGFDNYRGKLRIDDTLFNYVVRIGKAKHEDVFYDINIEVDSYLPHAESASDIKDEPTSKNSIRNPDEKINSFLKNNLKSTDTKYSPRGVGGGRERIGAGAGAFLYREE